MNTNPLRTIIERSFCHCCQGRPFLTKHCDVTTIDLWRHANAKYWYCDVIFVYCNCTRKLAQRLSSLVNIDISPPGIHGLACKKKQFSMSWSHWYRSIWWSYCTNFSLGNFSILLLLSNYQLDTDVSHILWLMFLCVSWCIITWHVRILHTWKLKVGLDLCYCGKEVKLLLWISWTILSCKFLTKPLSQYGKESN